ncbi:MAG TPA: phospholipid carrier-dependent glycosyltransferase [Patescibacteria group bacterium]
MKKYTSFLLPLILAFAFFTRVWHLHLPEQYIFDEVYHAVTAKLIARNDPWAYEWWNPAPEPDTAVDWLHPPLAKYTQAAGMLLFGENTFGWRISSALFGVGVIYLTYILAKELWREEIGLLAAFIASLDGLLLTQSRIAMNDIHVTFFILLTLILYLKYRAKETEKPKSKAALLVRDKSAVRLLFLTGASAGLAMGSKWSGLFVLAIVWFFHARTIFQWFQPFTRQKKQRTQFTTKQLTIKIASTFLFLGILPLVVYVLSYAHMFFQGKSLVCSQQEYIPGQCYYEVIKWGDRILYQGYVSHFSQLHRQIWHYQTHLEATHSYQSRPYEWFLNLRPVWYYVKYGPGTLANIYALGNPVVFWLGGVTVVGSLISLGLTFLSKAPPHLRKDSPQLFFLLISYLMVWLPWQLSPRIMFFYHYTPAVPLLSIILAYWLYQIHNLHIKDYQVGKIVVTLCVMLATCCFLVWYPNWTGQPVPTEFAENVYFVIKSWR